MTPQGSSPATDPVTLPWEMQARVSLMLARTTRDTFDREQRMLDYERAMVHVRSGKEKSS